MRCPCCNEIITNDDCGSSVDRFGYTDCCNVHYITGESPEIKEEIEGYDN